MDSSGDHRSISHQSQARMWISMGHRIQIKMIWPMWGNQHKLWRCQVCWKTMRNRRKSNHKWGKALIKHKSPIIDRRVQIPKGSRMLTFTSITNNLLLMTRKRTPILTITRTISNNSVRINVLSQHPTPHPLNNHLKYQSSSNSNNWRKWLMTTKKKELY